MPKDILKSCVTVYKNTTNVHVKYGTLNLSTAIFRKECIQNISALSMLCYRYHSTYPKVLPILYRDVNSSYGRIMLQNY